MKIFPKSSSLRDLVNYVLDRTVSHFGVYEYFKSIVLSDEAHSSVIVDFNKSSKFFNTELPINIDGDILSPDDMFGGKFGLNYPVITSFDRFPGSKTIPDILNDKLFRKISLSGDISNENVLTDDTVSSLLGFSPVTNKTILKYWPTFKVGEYWPVSNNVSNVAQLNMSTGISQYSIVKLDSSSAIFNHFDIEYGSGLTTTPIIFILLDKSANDGDYFKTIINFKNNDSSLMYNINAPLVVFLDEKYSDVAVNTSPSVSSLTTHNGDSIEIGGNMYKYVLTEHIDNSLISELPDAWDDPGYFILDNSFDKYGDVYEHPGLDIIFNGTSNKITYTNYGLFDSENIIINSDDDFEIISTPIYGETNPTILDNIDISYGKNALILACKNGHSFIFGKSDNTYSYNMASYSTSSLMNSILVDQGYLPYNMPRQVLKGDVVNLSSSYISGIFSTYDISYSLSNGYVVSTVGIQGTGINYHIRRHSSQLIIDDNFKLTTVAGSFSNISVSFGVKRGRDSIFKKILVFSNGVLVHNGLWIKCGDITNFDCSRLSAGAISFENIIVGSSGTNSITMSNIKILNGITSHALDSVFTRLSNGGVYNRNNTFSAYDINSTTNSVRKILRISSLGGYIAQSNSRYKYVVNNSNNNYYNTIVDNVSNRLDFTYHKNKSNFNYRIPKEVILTSSKNQSILFEDGDRCGSFYEYLAVTGIDCGGVSNIKFKVPSKYFGDYVASNSGNYSEYGHSPYGDISVSNTPSDIECGDRELIIDSTPNETITQILSRYSTLNVNLIDSRVDHAEISGWMVTSNYQIPQAK